MSVNTIVDELVAFYGKGETASAPTPEQWRVLLDRPAGAPLVLVNFFKLREVARYDDGQSGVDSSGQDAMNRYAAVSVPAMERAGGRFLALGGFAGTLVGGQEDWDMIAVGAYPDQAAFLTLFCDPVYRTAYHHRTAACERQQVSICAV